LNLVFILRSNTTNTLSKDADIQKMLDGNVLFQQYYAK
jgi:hypothetical protein